MEELTSAIIKVVTAVVLMVIPIILKPSITKLSKWIDSKIELIENEKASKLFNESKEFLSSLVVTTVSYLEQEYGSEIRKEIANGTGDKSKLYELKDKALEIVKGQISEKAEEILNTQITDVEEYIDNLISEEVLNLKKSK